MKLGLCTGGGDCPGLNAAIRAVVKAASRHQIEIWGIRDSFNGLMSDPLDTFQLKLEDVTAILDRGGTILGTTNDGDPFGNGLEKVVLANFKKLRLDGLIVIGGDGTQTISKSFLKMSIPIIGIPKTIDNDLVATELSIGFMTAVDIVTDSISRLKSTAESHQRTMVVEVMGRDAGYIALYSAIAGGANMALIPEIPFAWDPLVQKIEQRKTLGRTFSIVVAAEGAFEKGGEPFFKVQGSDHKLGKLGGVGEYIAKELAAQTQTESRVTVLGHVQRGGRPSPMDRIIATELGVAAIDLARQKDFGKMVGHINGKITVSDFESAQSLNRPLSLDHPLIHTAEAIDICLGR